MLIQPGSILANIDSPKDIKKLDQKQLVELCNDLRQFIVDNVSVYGGHFGASLGVVELTVALHYVFDTPYDQLVWDVGHQAYGHKILTGRKNNFHTNRTYDGIAGFPKMSESEYDAFGVGHSSTSISAVIVFDLFLMFIKSVKNDLMSRIDLFVSHDCGVKHIAAASEVPLLRQTPGRSPAFYTRFFRDTATTFPIRGPSA